MSKYRRVLGSSSPEAVQSVTPSAILGLSWKYDHIEGDIGRRAPISSLSDDAQVGLISYLRQEGIGSARFAMTPGTGESSITVGAQDTEKLEKLINSMMDMSSKAQSLSWRDSFVGDDVGRRASISGLSDDAQIGLIKHLRQEGISSARFAMTPGTGEPSIVVAAEDVKKIEQIGQPTKGRVRGAVGQRSQRNRSLSHASM